MKIGIKFLFLLIISFVLFIPLSASNILQIHDASGEPYDTITVYVEIINDDPFVAFQFDLPLPEHLIYLLNSAYLTDRSVDHIIISSIINNDTLRILSYSPTNTAFLGNNGNISYFKLVAGNVPGNYPLNLINPIISDSNSINILTDTINGIFTILPNGVDCPETNYDNTRFSILQNYPNPFSESTIISFNLTTESSQYAFINIYNIKGELVKTLECVRQLADPTKAIPMKSGLYSISWNGLDDKCKKVSTGVYFCRLEAKNRKAKCIFSKIHKLVIIK